MKVFAVSDFELILKEVCELQRLFVDPGVPEVAENFVLLSPEDLPLTKDTFLVLLGMTEAERIRLIALHPFPIIHLFALQFSQLRLYFENAKREKLNLILLPAKLEEILSMPVIAVDQVLRKQIQENSLNPKTAILIQLNDPYQSN